MSEKKISVCTTAPWRIYWAMPLPQNSTAHGTVTRETGETGALIEMHATGIYVQGNAGAIRGLPQREVIVALHQAELGARGGAARTNAKRAAVRANGRRGGRPAQAETRGG